MLSFNMCLVLVLFGGRNPEGDDAVGTSLPETNEGEKHRSEVSSRVKNMKINTRAKNPGKPFLPKIPNRQTRWDSELNRYCRRRRTCLNLVY